MIKKFQNPDGPIEYTKYDPNSQLMYNEFLGSLYDGELNGNIPLNGFSRKAIKDLAINKARDNDFVNDYLGGNIFVGGNRAKYERQFNRYFNRERKRLDRMPEINLPLSDEIQVARGTSRFGDSEPTEVSESTAVRSALPPGMTPEEYIKQMSYSRVPDVSTMPQAEFRQGYKTFGQLPDMTGQKSLFGERKYVAPWNQSIAQRVWNGFTDLVGLTSPPTYTDGYGGKRNAENRFWESAQGQQLERMGETALDATMIAATPFLIEAGLTSPLSTAVGIGTGIGTDHAVRQGLDLIEDGILHDAGYQFSNGQKNFLSFIPSVFTGAFADKAIRNLGTKYPRLNWNPKQAWMNRTTGNSTVPVQSQTSVVDDDFILHDLHGNRIPTRRTAPVTTVADDAVDNVATNRLPDPDPVVEINMSPSRTEYVQQPAPTPPTPTPPPPTVYDDMSWSGFRNVVGNSIGVFDDQTFAVVRPQVKQIIEDGYAAGKTPSEIISTLDDLWKSYDKPFFKEPEVGVFRANASLDPIHNLEQLLDGTHVRSSVNPTLSRHRLTIDQMNPQIDPANEIGYRHWYVVDADPANIQKLKGNVLANTPHGGATYEISKSLQSSPLAHQGYIRQAEQGNGIISYVKDPFGNYQYVQTNGMAGSAWRPRINGTGNRINNPTARELLDSNVKMWERMLNATDPVVFKSFGGAPKSLGLQLEFPEASSVGPASRFGWINFELPIANKNALSVAPMGTNVSTQPLVFKPAQLPSIKPDYRIDTSKADAAIQAFDDYVARMRQPQLDAVNSQWMSDLNALQQQPFTATPGAQIIETNKGLRIKLPGENGAILSPDLYRKQFVPNLSTSDVEIFDKIQQMELEKLSGLRRITVPGVFMNLTQPVAGFKLFQSGGKLPLILRFCK